MPTMMEHPIHGRHSASAGEMPRMLENGWTVMAPKVKPVEPQESLAVSEVATVKPVEPRQKRAYIRRQGT